MEKVEKDAGKKKKRRSKGEGSIYFDGKNPDSIKTRIETLQMLIISSSSRLSKNPDSIKTRIETLTSLSYVL